MIINRPETHPTICNICNGKVIFTDNSVIYGRKYGNGLLYLCTNCGAYVGCHPHGEALGILTDKKTKALRMQCHNLFDPFWKSHKMSRIDAYYKLAKDLNIPADLCHFGYFNSEQLIEAKKILEKWSD